MGGYTPSQTGEYDLWMKRRLGQYRYNRLLIRAETYAKRDDKLALMIVKNLDCLAEHKYNCAGCAKCEV